MSVASVGNTPISVMPYPEITRHTVKQQEAVVAAEKEQPEPKVKPKIESAAADLEQIGHVFNKRLRFEMDHHSNQVIVKVIDKNTDKVIKELPPEELQRLHNNVRDALGILFDERV